ncbi:hypothetical protein [Streptomyces sp. UG1]|uniref:hypothetical protein n=1 Tax=Streptomyces sp. UG1 TaxID=3417652 RepID=UPI003CF5DB1E
MAIPSSKRRPYGDVEGLAQRPEGAVREAGRAAEANRLLDQAEALRATPRAERSNAGVAAWEVIRSSHFAAALDALQEAPDGIENIAVRLAEMRVRASRLAHDVDQRTRKNRPSYTGGLSGSGRSCRRTKTSPGTCRRR